MRAARAMMGVMGGASRTGGYGSNGSNGRCEPHGRILGKREEGRGDREEGIEGWILLKLGALTVLFFFEI